MTVRQIGVTAMRDPATGAFLPSVPLYINAEDSGRLPEAMSYDLRKLASQVEEYRKESARLEAEAKARKEARKHGRQKKARSSEPEDLQSADARGRDLPDGISPV